MCQWLYTALFWREHVNDKYSKSIKHTFNLKNKLQASQCFCMFYLEIILWKHYLFESGVSDNKHYININEASSETESLFSLRFWPFKSLISILPQVLILLSVRCLYILNFSSFVLGYLTFTYTTEFKMFSWLMILNCGIRISLFPLYLRNHLKNYKDE